MNYLRQGGKLHFGEDTIPKNAREKSYDYAQRFAFDEFSWEETSNKGRNLKYSNWSCTFF